jgi:hypothetical protein
MCHLDDVRKQREIGIHRGTSAMVCGDDVNLLGETVLQEHRGGAV